MWSETERDTKDANLDFCLSSMAGLMLSQQGSHSPRLLPRPASPRPAGRNPSTLTFDVASVRPAAAIDQATIMAGLRAGKKPESFRIDGSRATFTYESLKELVAYAYKVRDLPGQRPRLDATDRFDIAARLPDGASRERCPRHAPGPARDRFKLAAHLETAEHPVLGLMPSPRADQS
jgi:hypothetical protein